MKRVVLDPGGFLAWFAVDGRPLRAEYEAGALEVHVPRSFGLDALERIARERSSGAEDLARLADDIERLGFREHDVSPVDAAPHLQRGRTASQAAYVALSVRLDLPLITDDARLLGSVPGTRRPADA